MELTIKRDSYYTRLFIWAWHADPEKLNLCKMFCGTLLFPVALCNLELEFGFVPRLSIFYWLASVFACVFSRKELALGMFLGGIVIAIFGFICSKIDHKTAEESTESEVLNNISSTNNPVVQKIADLVCTIIFPIFDGVDYIAESNTTKRVVGITTVAWEYILAVKARICPLIRVVD